MDFKAQGLRGFVITYQGRPYSVVAEDRHNCPAYTRGEWETESPADFELDANGEVLFQGRRVAATCHTCKLQEWATR